jgi:hypothetical protein
MKPDHLYWGQIDVNFFYLLICHYIFDYLIINRDQLIIKITFQYKLLSNHLKSKSLKVEIIIEIILQLKLIHHTDTICIFIIY